jgi:hypothetical protein
VQNNKNEMRGSRNETEGKWKKVDNENDVHVGTARCSMLN